MKIRDGIYGGISSNSPNLSPSLNQQIGKVYGVINTLNTPTKKLFEENGGWNGIGTVFYIDYDSSKNDEKVDLSKCKTAKPYNPSVQNYPLIGELINIVDGPSPSSQLNSMISQKYYTNTINIWNNPQQNSPADDSLGKTFIESADIRNLVPFEGDIIYQGRKGNGIRFGSTTTYHSDINEWSSAGKDGDPITILVNGYVTTSNKDLNPNIEEVNKELSSIYLTSSQKIPLKPDMGKTVNLFTKPVLSSNYINPQIIFNSDRITINSKKDEVMLFAKTNIELCTNNIINLNAGNRVHLNSNVVMLGNNNDILPNEPVLLGFKTVNFLLNVLKSLSSFTNTLSSATTPPAGSPLMDVNIASTSLGSQIDVLINELESLLSKTTFTS